MRIWPILLDSRPDFSDGRDASLLLCPLGELTVLEHLRALLDPLTAGAPPLVVRFSADADYRRRVQAACPTAQVAAAPEDVAEAIAGHELSDALLIVDPRCLPAQSLEWSALVRHHTADPRISHQLVAFGTPVGGTKERVSFDAEGNVRKILRHYEPATWPFIIGVPAALVPVATGILGDGIVPESLLELRQLMAGRGIPARDVGLESGALDLSAEAGFLAANELFVRRAAQELAPSRGTGLTVGGGHSIAATARISGPVAIHADAQIGENAMVLGPAVIGAGARVGPGAVIAHAVLGPEAQVPGGTVVRNRTWFGRGEPGRALIRPLTYADRLARLVAEGRTNNESRNDDAPVPRGGTLNLKRAFDVAVSSAALLALSPLLLAAAAAVRLGSKGPIFYGDRREGVDGRAFRCWKFRTMSVGANDIQKNLKKHDRMDGPHFKLDNDPRVTKVGRILRALNIDELPQLFNVLVGEMSLVGPRPSPFRENQICIPWREARLSVRPGITGFWQVCRHDRAAGDFHQWIEYDLLYVQHLSVWLDVKILCATIATLGGKVGAVRSSWLVPSLIASQQPLSPSNQRIARASEQAVTT
jgi:lipopolysaccharide/colanic/teichoic acid biosynthesis glycosyltransferase